jgi:hypothetical protein
MSLGRSVGGLSVKVPVHGHFASVIFSWHPVVENKSIQLLSRHYNSFCFSQDGIPLYIFIYIKNLRLLKGH